MMTLTNVWIAIAIIALATMITRFVPFLFFGKKRKIPGFVLFMEKYMPGMVMMILVIYCLQDVSPQKIGPSLNLILASAMVVVAHLWKKNALISIFGGTALYMFLVQSQILERL